jgi:uncharacterized protein (TIGR03382 family)
MRLTQPTHSAITLALCALSLFASAPRALAETSGASMIDTNLLPIIDNIYWEGSIPSGDFIGVPIDVALPLPLRLLRGTTADTADTADAADNALSFITVTVIPSMTPDATPIEGVITYTKELQLVLWTPTQPLDPSTDYNVDVFINNEGLRGDGSYHRPNISGGFNITTNNKIFSALPPVIQREPTVTFTQIKDWTYCPSGEVICQDDPYNFDENGNPSGVVCASIIFFYWSRPFIRITWDDGEEDGDELFFSHLITAREGAFVYSHLNGEDVLKSTHSSPLILELLDSRDEEVCLTIEATDLRSIAYNSADGTTTTTHCISLADMPPLPDIESSLAACGPPPNIPDADVSTYDTTSGSDADGNNIADSDIGADDLSDDDIEASACGCTTTRSQQKQAPVGLLLGLAVAFGAALSLRRRRD